jgi:hypothetical protein
MRYGKITTFQAIEILARDGCIYFTDEAWQDDGVDWLMVSIFFNTQEIHGFTQGYKVRIDL